MAQTSPDIADQIARDPVLTLARDALVGALAQDSADPAHDLEHCTRVARWTMRLAPEVPVRHAILAALLHDLVNVPKDAPDRHLASVRSAEAAADLLGPHLEEEAVAEIAAAIRDHSFSRGAVPESDLGRALQDADRLEALGAIGLCRTISTGGRMGAVYFHPADPWASDRALDDRRFSVDHFFTKLLGLPATFLTPLGREEATRRVKVLEQFLDALAHELEAPRPS